MYVQLMLKKVKVELSGAVSGQMFDNIVRMGTTAINVKVAIIRLIELVGKVL